MTVKFVKNEAIIKATCPFCGKLAKEIRVSAESYVEWAGGELIQNVWPDLTPQERETIKTGICNECWPEEEVE